MCIFKFLSKIKPWSQNLKSDWTHIPFLSLKLPAAIILYLEHLFLTFLSPKDGHRIQSDLPDLSDEELIPTEPLKSSGRSFKHKNDSDLFGLGFEEKSIKSKESSDEQDGES